jgi:hypothetical protein
MRLFHTEYIPVLGIDKQGSKQLIRSSGCLGVDTLDQQIIVCIIEIPHPLR